MKTLRTLTVVVLALVVAAVSLSAHHSWPVKYDKLTTVRGKVTEIKWGNPHPMFTLEVLAADGRMEQWQVGGAAIGRMEAKGWTRDTIKPGDVITGIGYQFTDGQKIIRLERVVLPDGKEISVYAR
jgi:hypothetical protein